MYVLYEDGVVAFNSTVLYGCVCVLRVHVCVCNLKTLDRHTCFEGRLYVTVNQRERSASKVTQSYFYIVLVYAYIIGFNEGARNSK